MNIYVNTNNLGDPFNLFQTDNALVGSRGDAKRLIKQGAVSIDGNKVSDINFEVSKTADPQILKVGKRKFIKIV